MRNANQKFWPLQPRFSLIAVALLLISFLGVVAGLRVVLRWPSAQSDNIVLVGILLLSLLPIVLAILDVIIERGGVVLGKIDPHASVLKAKRREWSASL